MGDKHRDRIRRQRYGDGEKETRRRKTYVLNTQIREREVLRKRQIQIQRVIEV